MAYTDIDDPTAYFQTVIYNGTGSSQSITYGGNSDMQPDFLWFKRRDSTANHRAVDSVRGNTKGLNPNQTNAEDTLLDQVTAFNSNGFSLGVGSQGYTNTSGGTFVNWGWKADGTASSNTDGSITSSVSANTTSGFSIVSYTGTGSNATVGHGLGTAPSMMIFKNRDRGDYGWRVYHKSLGATKNLNLQTTGASETSSSRFNNTEPTSSVFSIGTDLALNTSSQNIIAYCFAEKKGYSKFGSFTGNGNADGTFVYTGFKPAFCILKRTDSTSNWWMVDNKRNPSNVVTTALFSNTNGADDVNSHLYDFLSNGIKVRDSGTQLNASGGSYIYMAFAENPFVTSTGIPAPAR